MSLRNDSSSIAGHRGHPKSGEFGAMPPELHATCGFVLGAFALIRAVRSVISALRLHSALTDCAFRAEHGLKTRISLGTGGLAWKQWRALELSRRSPRRSRCPS